MRTTVWPPIIMAGWLPPADLSPNARVHWRAKHRATRQVRKDVWFQVQAAGWPRQEQHGPRRRLTITMTRPRRLDPDNAVAICKAIVDGVREAGALWNDSAPHCEVAVRQENGPACTALALEEMGDMPSTER